MESRDNSRDPRPTALDAALAEVAERQHGLVTDAQLGRAGLAKHAISYRLKVGRLHRIHRGVYALGHRQLTHDARAHAAVLAVGARAALSHVSAAILWGLLRLSAADPWRDVDVATTRRVHQRRGIKIHVVRALPPRDVTHERGIPVTRPARTLLDLAAVLGAEALRRVVHEAEVRRLVNPADLRVPPNTRGGHKLRAILAQGPAPTRSELEDRTLDLLAKNDLPRPLVNARVRTHTRTYEVDFLFPRHRLIIEADGRQFHGTRVAKEDDQAKQAALEAAGYAVLRVIWAQVNERAIAPQTVQRIRQALGHAAPRA